ncbi:MAG: glycosyltransferase [Treponemataceae bacterium]|nr:glycosyltransferase [Treponemataceae bacterium]
MVIVFVIDNYGILTNGTTITAYRFVEALKARGHTVRVVSVGVSGPDMYALPKRYIPIVSEVARGQSVLFAKPVQTVLEEAFRGADVVHLFMPWKLARRARRIAREMGIPCTAAFHVQPENITYGAGLGPAGSPLAHFIYHYFRWIVYRHVDHIHCPSQFIARELRRHGYTAHLHVISNGIHDFFHPPTHDERTLINPVKKGEEKSIDPEDQEVSSLQERTPVPEEKPFTIIMVGRYAPEKRQDVLIKAIGRCRYRDRIRLILAGAGPREAHLRRLAEHYGIPTTFGFYQQDELRNLLWQADLYVHAADVEIEAIACLEAIACGKVPVISDSKKSATRQFALDERSLFRHGSSRDLAQKIEYWIEHPEERHAMEERYYQRSRIFRLEYSVKKAERMFEEAMLDEHVRRTEAQDEGKAYKKRILKGLPTRLFSLVFYYLVAIPLLWLYCTFVLRVRFHNRKVIRRLLLRREGAVTIANHVHTLDSAMVGLATFPRKPIFTSLPANFNLPVAGFLVNILGSVPIPSTITENGIFFYELSRRLRRGRYVHFYPEGELVQFDENLRPFKRGAFQLAVDAQVPIIPIGISFKKGKPGFLGFFFRRQIHVRIGDPLYPDVHLQRRDALEDLGKRAWHAMETLVGPRS